MGRFDSVRKIIELDGSQHLSDKRATLLHEIYEAVNEIYTLQLPHDRLTFWAALLFQVIAENPRLMLYLVGVDDEPRPKPKASRRSAATADKAG